ncbi:hypothetical protein DAPPUDRAFT_239419 [Daphnia pulex]|uniref:Uncharacterized protein n=1 Tax=Daphnia pulex TaxID=6669 RepID=E9G997_DAPPU|nr:hypothetical protein DAPPUDRAFT_239419 [Daphnia pulex]|eukprot:EFX84101.1 hypothetical protein DAPPUDRAFT_239419 [Daphnia pulex]
MNISVARSFFVDSCGPGTDILEPTLAFVHDQRSAPSLSVIFPTYAHPASASSFRTQKYNLSYFLTSWNTSVVATLCCYTPAVTYHGIMPRKILDFGQILDFV